MEKIKEDIMKQLENVRLQTLSDFSAVAWVDRDDPYVRWKYVAGNLNDRYKQIRLRPGKGLLGWAIRIGRPVILDNKNMDLVESRYDYPIMIAENLITVIAFPLTVDKETQGVLLVANRSSRSYEKSELDLVAQAAGDLASLLHSNKLKMA